MKDAGLGLCLSFLSLIVAIVLGVFYANISESHRQMALDVKAQATALETLTNRRAIFDVTEDGACVVNQFDTLEVP